MRNILIVSATAGESAWLRGQALQRQGEDLQTDFLVTGVGMTATALALGRYLATHQPDLAIMTGIAGSFREDLPLGSVVEVTRELFPELGAESPEGFLDLSALGFPQMEINGEPVFNDIRNPHRAFPHLPAATGLTVNRVSGISSTIEARKQWQADIETMEGGAFFLAMKEAGIPFIQLRGISNRVEPRIRESWNIVEAMNAVQREIWKYVVSR